MAPTPASLLFKDDDLKFYLRWQLQQATIPPERRGDLPDAFEYADYLEWRKVLTKIQRMPARGTLAALQERERAMDEVEKRFQLLGEGWVLAHHCKHPLHPVHPGARALQASLQALEDLDDEDDEDNEGEIIEPVLRCPVCIVRAHMELSKLLMERWSDFGGPWRNVDHEKDPGALKYNFFSLAYRKAKSALVITVHAFQEWADQESEWETQHPESDIREAKDYTATAAVAKNYAECHSPGQLLPAPEGFNSPIGKEKTPKKKKLTFTPDTPDSRNRPNTFFSRSSSFYDKNSQYSCNNEEGWLDTSFFQDYEYTISQCRILLLIYDATAETEVSYVDLNAGDDKGENEHVTRLQELVAEWASSQDEDTREHYLRQCASISDTFVVYKGDLSGGTDFNSFMVTPTLVGTCLEEYARLIGDIEGDE